MAGLWPDEQPEHPAKALQILVSRTRARLGPDVIVTTPTGYRLALAEDQVDTSAVLRHAAVSEQSARTGDHAAALSTPRPGSPCATGAEDWDHRADDPLSASARRPAARRYRTLGARPRAGAGAARPARRGGSARSRELAREQPRGRGSPAGAAARRGGDAGPATALARYDAYRRALRDELGTDPGPALRQLHRELLLARRPRCSGTASGTNPTRCSAGTRTSPR